MQTSVPASSAAEARRLKMQYAGGLVKHLGLAMYRGAVPALAELISNAWDADATRVSLDVPFGTGMQSQVIRVSDDGCGMSWDDVDQAYLVVGRDRRRAEGRDRSPRGRAVMGRKGLGKLAGFGIARVVEVRTVRSGWLTHFRMDFDRMTRAGEAKMVEDYEPLILADLAAQEPDGTSIMLTDLQISRSIDEVDFRESMSRRFAILGTGFEVVVNGVSIPAYQPELQFRFEGQNKGWEDVSGVGSVKWWMGFTQKPVATESARGVSILVRGKMAQAPFFFGLSGGTHGQVGMQYLLGEVHADQLDRERDYVGTDRQGVVWTEPMPEALLAWGQKTVRAKLAGWAPLRTKDNEKELTRLDPRTEERIGRLRPVEQREAREVIRKLASFESVMDEPDRAKELLDLVLRAFEDSSFFALIKALAGKDQAERDEVLKLVTELDVFETVKFAEIVRARIGVIKKFEEMLEDDVPEKPDMQSFLFEHPWLIDPEWLVVEHERSLERLLIEQFGQEAAVTQGSRMRVDFFCISTRGRYLVVEVKRPSKTLGRAEITQTMDYVRWLRQQNPGEPGRPNHYEGVLVGHHVSTDGEGWREMAGNSGVTVRSWKEILGVAERTHRAFLDAMKRRVPGDSRVQSLQIASGTDADAAPGDDHR